ncbi:hypothetical protein NGF19_29980 [Streptomyces sp. RY43-2]|uniref:Uncharacterized protein n=1 Tax=Streptomyces macrolidinus TaxID=2952607 RepID=A0ABT0ZMZ4_9ACTN|nr:hypothetical protein [Streptomyces macrolidinus]MCN9244964.1 hypothetical protein [Streptomyces macrolidinus]
MNRTEFANLSFFWGCWTFFEAAWIGVLWQSRSRVPGCTGFPVCGACGGV